LDNGYDLICKKEVKIDPSFLKDTGNWYTKSFPKVETSKEVKLEGED
jgi:hypothetical protein